MNIFAALSDPTRLKIVEMLSIDGPKAVVAINEPFDMSAPAVSQHLKALRDAGLVLVEKDAQRRIYKVNHAKLDEINDWMTRIRAGLAPRNDFQMKRKYQPLRNGRPPSSMPEGGALEGFLRKRAKK